MKVLPEELNFLALEEEFSNLKNSQIAIVSAPYEHSVSYGGGTRNGPDEIIKASAFVEFYDDEFHRELCFEKGITTIEPIDFMGQSDQYALSKIEEQIEYLFKLNKFIVTLGGEHTISIAPIKAHFNRFPDMTILHFDAHSDLRDTYADSKYSHASFMARVAEFFPNNRITQVGVRAQCIEEAEFIKSNGIKTFYSSSIRRGLHSENWQKSVVDTLGEKIYITFDVDYFDPAIIPSTGTPEPDGFLYSETLDIFRQINKSGKQIVGFDVVELAPMTGLHHPNLTTARLIYKLLNFSFYNK
jgi:agmatinase